MEIIRYRSELLKKKVTQAWRERWSDVQWSTEIKKIIPCGVSGDVYNLADILLNQVFVGPTPNTLLLSYLEHSISCQIVSCTAVFNSMITYEDVCTQRPYCMKSLLDIFLTCVSKLGGHCSVDECLLLARSYLQVVLWLLRCIAICANKIKDTTVKADVMLTQMLDMIIERFLKVVCLTGVSRLLLFIGKTDDEDTWRNIENAVDQVKDCLVVPEIEGAVAAPMFLRKELKEKVTRAMQEVLKIPFLQMHVVAQTNSLTVKGISCIVNMITYLEAAINITNDVHCFVDQILIIEKVQHIPRHTLVKELCHSAFLGLVDHIDCVDELKWQAFAFVKLPQIFSCLNSGAMFGRGIKELLQLNTLLDTADSKSKCDCLQHLLTQCVKLDVITETLSNDLIQLRANNRTVFLPSKKDSPLPNATLLQQAETTANSILSEKTFNDPDFSKIQDDLLGVLGQLMAGKSFDLIVAVEAATGKLNIFTSKLIRYNEWSKNASGEGGKQSQVRALLFDFTFLMLCHIAQMYGVQMVLDKNDSFFESWIVGCLPNENGAKPLELMVKPDQNKVEMLLKQCATSMEFKTSLVRWHEACACVPHLMEEIFYAWLHNTISQHDVKKIIDNIKSKLHCLTVCVVAWLCSYLRTLQNSERAKAKEMLHMFMSSNSLESSLVPYDKERNTIKLNVIKKMARMSMGGSDFSPELSLKNYPPSSAIEMLSSIFHCIMKQGFINKSILATVEKLQSCLGHEWFCRGVVDEILKLNSKAELMIAVEIALGMFHINIEKICPVLITKIIPRLLSDTNNNKKISGARGHALACILVWTIAAAVTHNNKDSKSKDDRPVRGLKRQRSEFDKEETGIKDEGRGPSSKLRRLLSSTEDEGTPEITGKPSNSLFVVPNVHLLLVDPLNHAIATLLQLFSSIIIGENAGPRSEFLMSFFQELLHCNEAVVKHVLQFVAGGLMDHLLCISSGGSFFIEFVMAVCSLGSSTARRMAVNALCQRKPVLHNP